MQEMKAVFVRDHWRLDSTEVEKEGDIYQRLERAEVPYYMPAQLDMGNNVRNSTALVQKYRGRVWVGDTGIFDLVLYRISLNKPAYDLVTFKSTYELARAISHAMKAHDDAHFNAKILHGDVSAKNILSDQDGTGFLIDWDLCARADIPPSTRQSQRLGTWQFMSAALLRDPENIRTIEDDRESALHLLAWLALRYTKHSGLRDIKAHLAPYDEIHHTLTAGVFVGGGYKGDSLSGRLFPTFPSDPLNRLFRELRRVFSARYVVGYSVEQIKKARHYVQVSGAKLDPRFLPASYIYGARMESLKQPNWLVGVFNKHLESPDWPLGDMVEANTLSREY